MIPLAMGLAALALGQQALPDPEPASAAGNEVEAEAAPLAVDPLPFIALAIYEGRLVQARTMLDNIGPATALTEPEVALLWAELALAQGDTADARKRLDELNPLADGLQCRVNAAQGQLALHDRDLDRAIGFLGDATAACPHDWRSWNRLAILLDEKGEADASRYAFGKALDGSRGALQVRGNFALFLMRHGDQAQARRLLGEALNEAPLDPRLNNLLIRLDAMDGVAPTRDPGESAERWAEKLAIAGQGARDGNRIELAKTLFTKALLAAPRFDAESWANLQALMETDP